MSDSDSDNEWEDIKDRMTVKFLSKNDTIIALRPSEKVFERWISLSVETRREAGQRMRICAFWLPILLQRDDLGTTVCWAIELGLISRRNREISLKHLHRIEIVEAILRALEKGTVLKDQTKHVVSISNMFNLRSSGVLEDALHWLERTGEPHIRKRVLDLGQQQTCYTALHIIFTEFAKYIQEMGTNVQKTMKSLMAQPSDYLVEKSDAMKKTGNEFFKRKQYVDAVVFYSKALLYYPDNHIIYGNRALCYIRCEEYLKAVCDGKCAVLIKPLWAKGHYRYCEALCALGKVKKALEANAMAQKLCVGDLEGVRVLEQQYLKITEEHEPKVAQPKKTPTKKPENTNKAQTVESRPQVVKAVKKIDPPPQTKVTDVKLEKQPVKSEKTPPTDANAKNSKPSKSELSSKNGKGASSSPAAKKNPKNKNVAEDENQKVCDKTALCNQLKSMVQDAHTALADLRSRNAEEAFRKALVLVETSTPKELGLSTLDVLLLLFGHASALTEIGQLEELGEAQRLLEKIKSFEERTFQCLVYYAIGRVYLRENRFALALEQFSDSLQTVKNRITPGKLTWPYTKEIVKETQPEYFKEILQHAIELCKFPPIPDAICRHEKCLGHLKAEIYLTDPDFKGYIQLCCCKNCSVEYHIACWKTFKTSFLEKNEKDFLHESCLTPDCIGQICSIRIFGPTGLPKCKFEDSIAKPQAPKKPKVNQKCTSLKKLKSKEEHKLKRKQHKELFQEKQAINDEILQQKEDSPTHGQQKAWLLYRDRVLLQISQNMELLREEKGLRVSILTDRLKPWLELDSSRGNSVARRILNWQQEPLETLTQVVELLLERKNRVWARILIELLSGCLDINPKLSNWACQLNNAGLNAAKSFVERYAGHLEELDLAFLFKFGPLQDAIIEKLGTTPELFSGMGLTEYLKEAPPQDTRLFIWTLEEHRDEYHTCYHILDDYFDMMDGHCSVLKKSDENQNNSPMKSRGRKKKQREPRSVFVIPETRALTPRDEWDQDFFEDESLSFLDPGDLFSVPIHLREQVADFEDQYNSTRHRSHYKMILDNNPDPTKESLYDYFAQILEEHGPLVAEDPLLVGELGNFPPVAQRTIQEAGGFESFLLESLRFIKIGRCIGLAKHAVSLQQTVRGAGLDDLDVIADHGSDSHYLDEGHQSAFTSYLDSYSSAQTDVRPILPNPYVKGSRPLFDDFDALWCIDDGPTQPPYVLPNDYGDLDLDDGLLETSTMTIEKNFSKKHAEVQTCQETMRSVAVNTEIHERFESCQGDINAKQKNNKKLEQQIKKMAKGCDKVNLKRKEEITVLEADIKQINGNINATNKELAVFQQKLEEEVKKDQKEKKANQEGLKALKDEIDELSGRRASLAQKIQEGKNRYDAMRSDYLELCNQSAAEKMSLEDAIQSYKSSFTSATRRSQGAQVLIVESSRDQGLYGLYQGLAIGKALLGKLDEAVHRFPTPDLERARNGCRVNVQEIEKKIATAEAQYVEQLDQVNKGRRLSELPPVNVHSQSDPAAAPSVAAAACAAPPPSFLGAPLVIAPPAAEAASAQPPPPQLKPPARTPTPQHSSVFDRSVEHLAGIFPDYSRSELSRFIQELRSSSSGSLSGMTSQEMVGAVTQLILDHQEKPKAAKLNGISRNGEPRTCTTPPPVAPVWQTLGQKKDAEKLKAAKATAAARESPAPYAAPAYASPVWQPPEPAKRTEHSNALNLEDPCIICHEDMNPIDTCVLVCRHSFHDECIRSWLKEHSTCPTCRDHALLVDDFPALSGRRRKAL